MVRARALLWIGALCAACSSTETSDETSDGTTSSGEGGSSSATGGAGGGATGSPASNGAGGAPDSATGSGGVGGNQICADLCAHARALGCPTAPDCEGDCAAGFEGAGECVGELETFLGCVAYESTTCEDLENAPPACERAAQALVECTGG